MKLFSSSVVAYCLLICLGWAKGYAEEKNLQNFNPFVPHDYQAPRKVKPQAKPRQVTSGPPMSSYLEVRGFFTWQGRTEVSIFDRRKNRSFWLAADQSFENITVQSINPDKQSTILEDDSGNTGELFIKKRSEAPLEITGNIPNSNSSSLEQNNDSDDVPVRVRRRRVIIPRRRSIPQMEESKKDYEERGEMEQAQRMQELIDRERNRQDRASNPDE